MRFNNAWCYRHILGSKGFRKSIWQSRRNVLADAKRRKPPAGPYMAELDITYRCNCRCRMCQRWRDPRTEALDLADYQRLANDFKNLGGVHQISIAGGEPLMRPDAISIIQAFAHHGMSVNLCTNGILLKKYHRDIYESGATCITVSLDGATPERHDAIRGTSDGYREIEEGIEALLRHRKKNRPVVRVRMTISGLNQHEVSAFYQKWRSIADDVLLQPVHHCNDSYYTGMSEDELRIDPVVVSKQIQDTPLEKDGYMKKLLESLQDTGLYPKQPCYAGVLMTRIDPWGNVYPCLEQHVCVGSLLNQDFHSIWHSSSYARERERLTANRQCRCWYNNTALIGHYGRFLKHTGKDALLNAVGSLTNEKAYPDSATLDS